MILHEVDVSKNVSADFVAQVEINAASAYAQNGLIGTTAFEHWKWKLEKAAQGKCCPVRSIGLRA